MVLADDDSANRQDGATLLHDPGELGPFEFSPFLVASPDIDISQPLFGSIPVGELDDVDGDGTDNEAAGLLFCANHNKLLDKPLATTLFLL